MKPFILEFKESPEDPSLDFSFMQYDPELNLNINTITGDPAIESIDLETMTFTKAGGESSDKDYEYFSCLAETETRTFAGVNETSDSDR